MRSNERVQIADLAAERNVFPSDTANKFAVSIRGWVDEHRMLVRLPVQDCCSTEHRQRMQYLDLDRLGKLDEVAYRVDCDGFPVASQL